MAASNGETLSQALASILRVYFPVAPVDVGERSALQQFGLFWLGAMVFLYPLFLMKIVWKIERFYGEDWMDLTLLSVIGLVPCAVLAVFAGWLMITGSKTKQGKARLFLQGFLLPYLVAFLLSRLM